MKQITLFVGHGSRDMDGNQEFVEFVEEIKVRYPEDVFESCFLELTTPTIPQGIDTCVANGATHIVVVPVILLAATHVKLEIPEMMDAARAKYPHVQIVYGRNIGLHSRIVDLLTARFHESTDAAGVPAAETALVLMGRGSSDPDANGDLYKIARQVWETTGVRTVEVCFTGITFPRVPEGVERAIALGAKQIVVVPYFLFTGVLIKRMQDVLHELSAKHPQVSMTMAGYFGRHDTLFDIVMDRRDEAIAGQAFMNCDLCKYRKLVEHTHDHNHSHDHHDDHNHNHDHHDDHNHNHDHHDDHHCDAHSDPIHVEFSTEPVKA